jgi:hypothetical protein
MKGLISMNCSVDRIVVDQLTTPTRGVSQQLALTDNVDQSTNIYPIDMKSVAYKRLTCLLTSQLRSLLTTYFELVNHEKNSGGHTGSQRSFSLPFLLWLIRVLPLREYSKEELTGELRTAAPSAPKTIQIHPHTQTDATWRGPRGMMEARMRHGRSNRSNNEHIEVTALRYTLLLYGHNLGTVI